MIATFVNFCLLIALTGKAQATQTRNASVQEQSAATKSIPPDTTFTLKRGGYAVIISADGNVDFQGTRFEVDIANVKSRLSPDEMMGLVRAFERANYFDLPDKYDENHGGCPMVWTDCDGVITSFRINGRFKVIDHYYGCLNKDQSVFPAELEALEDQIEDVLNIRLRLRHPIPPDTMITLSEEGLLVRINADGEVAVEGQTFDFDIGQIRMK